MPRWDSASKDKQRLLIQQQRPWTRSTGPVTRYGRQISSQNATKKHRRRQSEPPTPMSSDVTLMSLQTNEGDRPLQVGDRVRYIGGFAPTMLACGHEPMVVAGFCQLGTGAIACRTDGCGKIVWIYLEDLERT